MLTKLKQFIWALSSLKASLLLLFLLFIVVVIGTFAQINDGIFHVQKVYFQSWFLWIDLFGLSVPYFPGGGLIGLVLVISLTLSTILKLRWSVSNVGLIIIHLSLILLLIGAGLTSLLSNESQLYLAEGERKYFSEHLYDSELIIIDASHPQKNFITAIPTTLLKNKKHINHESLPFTIQNHQFYENAQIIQTQDHNYTNLAIKEGIGRKLKIKELKPYTSDDKKNNPTAILSFSDQNQDIGPFLFSLDINGAQKFTINNKDYYVLIQPKRFYFPFFVHLKKFKEEYYPGSDIARDYSSLVTIKDFYTQQERDVLIYMNHPLRHKGFTFYQASFGEKEPSSVLQVVENPTWLLPYISSCLIALGMIIHFVSHFLRFRKKQ